MAKFNVTDSDGNKNFIQATEDYVKATYASYEEVIVPQYESPFGEVEAREWRDQELKDTDWVFPLTDHPQHTAYKTYRQELRDWPSTGDFPDTPPTLGS